MDVPEAQDPGVHLRRDPLTPTSFPTSPGGRLGYLLTISLGPSWMAFPLARLELPQGPSPLTGMWEPAEPHCAQKATHTFPSTLISWEALGKALPLSEARFSHEKMGVGMHPAGCT